jgi:hypothetical protein
MKSITITEKQMKLLEVYAKKARLPIGLVVEWILKGKTTINEVSR